MKIFAKDKTTNEKDKKLLNEHSALTSNAMGAHNVHINREVSDKKWGEADVAVWVWSRQFLPGIQARGGGGSWGDFLTKLPGTL